MSLKKENIETKPTFLTTGTFRDIARMDEEQLESYLRKAFTGKPAKDFLPEPFWDYWFDMHKHGDTTDGRDAPGPACFFAGLHNTVGSVYRGSFEIGGGAPEFEFRPGFRKIIDKFLDESLQIKGEPTEEQREIASYAIEAVWKLKPAGIFLREGRQIGRERKKELDYSPELLSDLENLRSELPKMERKTKRLIKRAHFADLKLVY